MSDSPHAPETIASGEPEGGWVTAPTLIDTELLVTTLCRFSGEAVGHEQDCQYRLLRRHPDQECRALYFQGSALNEGLVSLEKFDALPEEVRVPFGGGDSGGSDHG